MKVPTMFAVAAATALATLVGCSSSSSGGGSGNVPTCQGSTASTGAGSEACNSCLQSHCGSQVSAVQSSCSAYVSCYEGCQCSDLQCIEGCLSKIDATCQNAEGPLTSCMSQNCSSQCNEAQDAGTGG